jgi:hypothetical protein
MLHSTYHLRTPDRGDRRPRNVIKSFPSVAVTDPVENWSNPGTSVTAISEREIAQLEARYTLQDHAKVIEFLQHKPHIVDVLIEAHFVLNNVLSFPTLSLEVVADPEIDCQQLVLNVATKLDDEIAIANFETFRQDWWLDNLDRARGSLQISLDFH